jgi:hypothetical protein
VSPHLDTPSWQVRRTLVIIVLLWCCAMTTYLALWGQDDDLRSTIANGVLFLAGSVLMGYVFGVVWNDTSIYKNSGFRENQDTGPTLPPSRSPRRRNHIDGEG